MKKKILAILILFCLIANTTHIPDNVYALQESTVTTNWSFDVSIDKTYEDCYIFVAIYDVNNNLLKVPKILMNVSGSTRIDIPKGEGDAYAKVYAWTDNMQPITEVSTVMLRTFSSNDKKLENILTELSESTVRSYPDSSELINGYYINAVNGKTTAHSSYSYMNLAVIPGSEIIYKFHNNTTTGLAFYDAAGTYITSYNSIPEVQHITVPENATIVKATVKDTSQLTICDNSYDIIEYVSDNLTDVCIPEFVLPSDSVAVAGHEWNMYFDNVISGLSDTYDINVSITNSIKNSWMYNDVLRITPDSGNIGDHTVTLSIKNKKTGAIVDKAEFTLHVIADTELTNKKVLFIGDSLTNAGIYPAEIQHNLSNGGIYSLGTLTKNVTIGNKSLTVSHEGRSGWAAYDYTRTRPNYLNNYNNPFWDGQKFNFSYYMENQGYQSVDVVCIGLGTNGLSYLESACDAIDIMINSIREYSKDVKILVALTPPPATQDGCGKNNHLQSSANLKRAELNQIKEYMKRWQNTDDSNLDIIELYFHLDTQNDFNTISEAASSRNPQLVTRQTNNVHPNKYGYLKFADAYYNRILYNLTK